MSKIFDNITQLIGNTPMLRLNNFVKNKNIDCEIIAKLEYFNPLSSIKDRIAFSMISDAKEKGLIKKGSTIIEPTSGNTGIGLAYIGAALGYKVILTMPETMSEERKKILRALGAELVLTDGKKGMSGAIEKAVDLSNSIEDSFIPNQFENESNPRIHRNTTAKEIIEDTNLDIDIFVAGVGTGGTISGVGNALKERNKNIKVVAVEPYNSAVLSGESKGIHKIQGIGAGFIPKTYDSSVVDQIIKIKDDEAFIIAKEVSKYEGILIGISSAAALSACVKLSEIKENKGKRIIVVFPDSGERYLSTDLF